MSPGIQLHEFDQELCMQLGGNLARLHELAFLQADAWGSFDTQALFEAHLKPELSMAIHQSQGVVAFPYVLDEPEFKAIDNLIEELPEQLNSAWLNNSLRMTYWRHTPSIVDAHIGIDAVDDWINLCCDYEYDLNNETFSLRDGFDVTRTWCLELRKRLEVMGSWDWIPRRESEPDPKRAMSPSPSNPNLLRQEAIYRLQNPGDQILEMMARIRIALVDRSPKISVDEVKKLVPGNNQIRGQALRCLEQRFEYAGFKHRRKVSASHLHKRK